MKKDLKRKSIAEFEAVIDLTGRYFVKGENHIRFSYRMHEKNEQFTLATPLEVAQFLKKHDIVSTYTVKGDQVTMYAKNIITAVGPKGEPVMSERLIRVDWNEIDFSPSDVVRFAAYHEFEKTMKQLSPVVRMFNTIIERVA